MSKEKRRLRTKLTDLPNDVFSIIVLYLSKYDALHERGVFLISKNLNGYLLNCKYLWKKLIQLHWNDQFCDEDLKELEISVISEYCLFRGRCEGIHHDEFNTFDTRNEKFDGEGFMWFYQPKRKKKLGRKIQSHEFVTEPIPLSRNGADMVTYNSSESIMDIFTLRDPPSFICFSELNHVEHHSEIGGDDHLWGMTTTDTSSKYVLWLPKLRSVKVEYEFHKYQPGTEESQPDYDWRFYSNILVNETPILVTTGDPFRKNSDLLSHYSCKDTCLEIIRLFQSKNKDESKKRKKRKICDPLLSACNYLVHALKCCVNQNGVGGSISHISDRKHGELDLSFGEIEFVSKEELDAAYRKSQKELAGRKFSHWYDVDL